MYELVHRYAPESPAGRTAVAIIASLVGVPGLVPLLVGLNGNIAIGILSLLVSVASFVIAGQLIRGVVRQANAAPTANPRGEREPSEATETPIETLRRRYAEDELSDESFQRRLDRLLETEELEHTTTDREHVLE